MSRRGRFVELGLFIVFLGLVLNPRLAMPETAPIQPLTKHFRLDGATGGSMSVVSEQLLDEVHKFLLEQKDIPYEFGDEGCLERSFEITRRLHERFGIRALDVTISGQGHQLAEIKSPTLMDGFVRFDTHTAPVLYVQRGKNVVPVILDMTFFKTPVDADVWIKTFGPATGYEARVKYAYRVDETGRPLEAALKYNNRRLDFFRKLMVLRSEGKNDEVLGFLKAAQCPTAFGRVGIPPGI